MNTSCELILALDLPDRETALPLLHSVSGELEWVKVGLSLFCRYGPPLVHEIHGLGFRIFLDLKLYDIPHQIEGTVRSLALLPVELLTIHASGGSAMLQAAAHAGNDTNPSLKLLGVTVLTSFDQYGLKATGIGHSLEKQVEILAGLSLDSGLDGLVCSPHELELLRNKFGMNPILLTPGIRPAGAGAGDQKRVMTPSQAAEKGSSFIVVGRPILQAENPEQAIRSILSELHSYP